MLLALWYGPVVKALMIIHKSYIKWYQYLYCHPSPLGCEWLSKDEIIRFIPKDVSQLITWQDGRCSADFLSSLPKPDSHLSVATGFGCATIFWYMKHR